ncbi:vacuolar membrane protein [Cryptococcus neoformans C23]|uniref:Vacuolar membrane protein n=1 Tax=Cryptococcus neoformans (strain H99 / ATCC 208821 / CBS 10515 / FGSC 9487) TaxID=235443 RepID=J9VG43_CRYN9|nr:vacuolar membrane protein [Cryptococcus neoformans var. grubii H99]AUB22880.1 vacuolar membrane protein [Cryptococcus neoformans var. grubii]OWZ34743.1 vacuolar membrane protein [Cryptococcus neoformans var. grubii AD2-60a]OWZ46842.1 vacuolar membrane protein [Cryptococcus neoformans var. grubii C23]OXC86335.1 vacuolar membrane protein [Cryptococcus neoformans var. grubii AD1-7a]OXG52778.1 vacuolar membrane protein [Cryptococcus neoformans var. grubii Th84]OXG87553.1 vacuolar membrane prot|eukprot:XP_012047248.1 vacuolar membrane protein [Cryptococcus neoformans var. grubii H99]
MTIHVLFDLSQSTKVFVASILGYASIACWLCAQLPQVVKNLSLQSCEGLALPFLVNWLFGDITNLIGCLLTHQLPFQTFLAAYFCIIDVTLLGQYFYYRQNQTVLAPTAAYGYASLSESPRQIFSNLPATAPLGRTRSTSVNRVTSPLSPAPVSRSRPKKGAYQSTSSYVPPPDISITTPSVDGSYAAIYEAALDVARAAERANARSLSRKRKLSRRNTFNSLLAETGREGDNDDGMLDSFHSDLSARSASTTRGSPKKTGLNVAGDYRGRSLHRGGLDHSQGDTVGYAGSDGNAALSSNSASGEFHSEAEDRFDGFAVHGQGGLGLFNQQGGNGRANHRERSEESHKGRSLSLARGSGGKGSRRAAGMTFMSLGLLVGWGRFGHTVTGGMNTQVRRSTGIVLDQAAPWPIIRHPHILRSSPTTSLDTPFFLEFSATDLDLQPHEDYPRPPEDSQSYQRIIGRISAWSCTTLYLTSRMPQIWKNFQRKSVEGLSILLFLFAFCGNVTYVFSILLNPSGGPDPAESSHYLLEALPYLLGSGGTLIFDLTIMIQSLIYGSAPPLPQPLTPLDRSSRRRLLPTKKRMRHMEDGWASVLQSQSHERGERAPLLGGSMSAIPSHDHAHKKQGTKRERSASPTVHKRARSVAG